MPIVHTGLHDPRDIAGMIYRWYPFDEIIIKSTIYYACWEPVSGMNLPNKYVTKPVFNVASFYQLYSTYPSCWGYSVYVCGFIRQYKAILSECSSILALLR